MLAFYCLPLNTTILFVRSRILTTFVSLRPHTQYAQWRRLHRLEWNVLASNVRFEYYVEEWKTNFMAHAILFHFLRAQHVSDINISTIRSLRLVWWITTLVVLFLVRCVLEFRCGWVEACNTDTTPTQPHRNSNTHRTKNNTTNVVIQQNICKLLMMDILMSETCWAHKKWNKIASDIKLVFYSSTITIMHGPINIRLSTMCSSM